MLTTNCGGRLFLNFPSYESFPSEVKAVPGSEAIPALMRQVTLPIMRINKGKHQYRDGAALASIVLDYVEFSYEHARELWSDEVGSELRRMLVQCADAVLLPHCPDWVPWGSVFYIDDGVEIAKEVPNVMDIDMEPLSVWTGVMPLVDEPDDMYNARVEQAHSYGPQLHSVISRMADIWMREETAYFNVLGSDLTLKQANRIAQGKFGRRPEDQSRQEYVASVIDPNGSYPVIHRDLHQKWIDFIYVRRSTYFSNTSY